MARTSCDAVMAGGHLVMDVMCCKGKETPTDVMCCHKVRKNLVNDVMWCHKSREHLIKDVM